MVAITLAAAVTSINTSSSHQMPDFNTLFETYLAFVPNAGDKTQSNNLPVQKNCARHSITACNAPRETQA